MPKTFENQAAWKRLGDQLTRRRLELGWRARSKFAADKGLTHDRILVDIENGKRGNYEPATLAQIETLYELKTGSIQDALAGRELIPLESTATMLPPETKEELARELNTVADLFRAAADHSDRGEVKETAQIEIAARLLLADLLRKTARLDPNSEEAHRIMHRMAEGMQAIREIELKDRALRAVPEAAIEENPGGAEPGQSEESNI